MARVIGTADEGRLWASPNVDLIEDVSLAIRIFQRGTRGVGEHCNLVLSLNGTEVHRLAEEAGDRAPAELVIDLRMPEVEGRQLMAALTSRPWHHPGQPVIMFAAADGKVGYLVRSAAVNRVLETVAAELDLELPDCAETALDAVGYGG